MLFSKKSNKAIIFDDIFINNKIIKVLSYSHILYNNPVIIINSYNIQITNIKEKYYIIDINFSVNNYFITKTI